VAVLFLFACASGCAATPVAPAAAPPSGGSGDPNAAPSLAALPELPAGAEADTPRTHQGLLAARAALDAAIPAPPADRSFTSLQRWIDSDVTAWVEQRRAQTAATRDRFWVEGEPNSGERVVSHAVIGLIHEDTALSLGALPPPSELETEPEIADMYRDVERAQSGSFLTSALTEFRACADAALSGARNMRGWALFCHARLDRLQREHEPPAATVAAETAAQ
jgi:hypothetical protein